MIYDYAIEPDVLIEWSRDQLISTYISESFGFGKTRLMAEYPNFKKWKKQFNKAWKQTDISDLDQSRLVELFLLLTESRIKRPFHGYDGEKEWLANAVIENRCGKPFKGIIARTNSFSKDNILPNDRVGSWDRNRWCTDISKRIPKTDENISEALSPIFHNCMDFTLVDPYFRASKEQWRKTFGCILKTFMAYRSSSDMYCIEIHIAEHLNAPSAEHLKKEFCSKRFTEILPPNIELRVKRWSQKKGGEKLHDRFLLTDIGCVQSSYGFDHGTDSETTSLTLLNKQDCSLIKHQYLGDNPAFELDFEFLVK